jgi:hypothetical protein
MRKLYWATAGAALMVAAACSDGVAPNTRALSPTHPNFQITSAANTNFYNVGDGTCSVVNGNIYPDQFSVALNGSPSDLGAGPWWVLVEAPGANPGDPANPLGHSTTADFTGDCSQLWSLVVKESDGTQGFDPTTNPGGEYRVVISTTNDFVNGDRKSDNFKIRNFSCVPGVDPECTEPDLSLFSVIKFYDANLDGVKQASEPFIDNWEFSLTIGGQTTTELTPYSEQVAVGSTYSASEHHPVQLNWYQTTPTGNLFTGTTTSSDLTLEFGNVCTGAGGGLTLGFWSNPNGGAAYTSGDNTLLASLNLKDNNQVNPPSINGNDFNPTGWNSGASKLKPWLLYATATNMAYMLSAQLAAMELNVNHHFVDGTQLIYVGTIWKGTTISFTGLNSLGFASVNDVMTAANTELGLHSLVTAAGDIRNYQEALKNALDAANNNLNFVQSAPCTFSFAAP